MKRFAILALSLFLPCFSRAMPTGLWISSHTATADATKSLCGTRRAILHGVCVNDALAASGTITFYDSRASATNSMAVIRSTAAYVSGCQFYDVAVSSGLTYSNSAANDITIMYQCY